MKNISFIFVLCALCCAVTLQAQTPSIVTFSPLRNATSAVLSQNISLGWNTPMNSATLNPTTIQVRGSFSGVRYATAASFSMLNSTTLTISHGNFKAGELITVSATRAVQSSGGTFATQATVFSFVAQSFFATGTGGSISTYTVDQSPRDVVVGDVNNDGNADLIVANYYGSSLSCFLGNGLGAFTTVASVVVSSPIGLVVGDVNNDGNLDIITANGNVGTVSVILGNGTGGFGSPVSYSCGAGPFGVALGDFNGDGNLDIVCSAANANAVSVLLGNGTGSFGTATSFSVGTSPARLVVGDWNNDGRQDIAVANYIAGTVSLLLGTGTGNFLSATTVSAGNQPIGIATGDCNGDGNLDLVIANSGDATILVRFGDGNGGFSSSTTLTVGTTPTGVIVSDFNGDGNLDILSVNSGANSVSVLSGNGAGGFSLLSSLPVGQLPYAGAIGDLNSDGALDMAVANSSAATLSVVFGVPRLKLLTPSAGSTLYAGMSSPITWTTASVISSQITIEFSADNGATWGAIATSATIAGTYTWQVPYTATTLGIIRISDLSNVRLRSECKPFRIAFVPSLVAVTPAKNIPSAVLSQNISLGWNIPMSTTTLSPQNVIVRGSMSGQKYSLGQNFNYPNSTTLTISHTDFKRGELITVQVTTATSTEGIASTRATQYSFYAAGSTNKAALQYSRTDVGVGNGPEGIVTGDFNGDGYLDLATANYGSATVSILLGSQSGNFSVNQNISVGGRPYLLTLSDFNNDGVPDIAVVEFSNNTVRILLGTGGGNFVSNQTLNLGLNPLGIISCDFNGDGNMDLAVTNYGSNNVSIFLGNGAGNFIANQNFGVGSYPYFLTLSDFNNDGVPDIATANYGGSSVSILIGSGFGTFIPTQTISIGGNPTGVTAGDFNGDGNVDLATANGSTVGILLGNGGGVFTATQTIGVGSGWDIKTYDINGDGILDLVTTSSGSGTVAILVGNGSGSFSLSQTINTGSGTQGVVSGDFNGDGILDIATANYSGNSVSILLGLPKVAVLFPNGGEALLSGTSATISWTTAGVTISQVKIEFSTNNGSSWTTITTNATNSGSYLWSVPSLTTTQALVRVSDNTNLTVSEQSQSVFILYPNAIVPTLVSPATGSSVGLPLPLTWTAVTNAQYRYQISAYSSFITLTTSGTVSSPSALVQNLSLDPAPYYWRVRSEYANGGYSAWSDSRTFIPNLTVNSPNGGEIWLIGAVANVQNIRWFAPNGTQAVKLEYTTNSGSTWTTIIGSTPATTGTYSWALPQLSSVVSALVRITDVSSASITDMSDAPFSLGQIYFSGGARDGNTIGEYESPSYNPTLYFSGGARDGKSMTEFISPSYNPVLYFSGGARDGNTIGEYESPRYNLTLYFSGGVRDGHSGGAYNLLPLQAPVLQLPTNNNLLVERTSQFQWTAVTSPTLSANFYQMQISTTPTFDTFLIDSILESVQPMMTLTTSNLTCYWRVRTINRESRDTVSPWSSVWTFATRSQPPQLTEPGDGSLGNPAAVLFKWSPINGATSYEIQVSEFFDFRSTVLIDNQVLTNQRLVSGVAATGQQYWWRVRSTSPTSTSDWSQTFVFNTVAQYSYPWGWTNHLPGRQNKNGSGAGQTYYTSVVADNDGNVYAAGRFQGWAWVDSVELVSKDWNNNPGSGGSWDMFIAKFDSSSRLVWLRQIGGYKHDFIEKLALDKQGNLYVTGEFGGTVNFNENPLPGAQNVSSATLTSVGNPDAQDDWYYLFYQFDPGLNGTYNQAYTNDIFLAVYTADGDFRWVRQVGNSNTEKWSGIKVGKNGEIVGTGYFKGTVSFGNTTLVSQGGFDSFIVRYNSIGDALWAVGVGGTSNDHIEDLALDSLGNIIVAGQYGGTISLSSTATISSRGGWDAFVAKFTGSGAVQWIRSGGAYDNDYAKGVAIDKSGNIYITGSYHYQTQFEQTTVYGWEWDMYVAKYNPSGDFQWISKDRDWQSHNEYGYRIAVDTSGNPIVVGCNTNYYNTFIRTYTPSGEPKLKQWGSNFWDGNHQWYGVLDFYIDSKGTQYYAGFDYGSSNSSPSYLLNFAGMNYRSQNNSYSGCLTKKFPEYVPVSPKAVSPVNGALGVSIYAPLQWTTSSTATVYHVQLFQNKFDLSSLVFEDNNTPSTRSFIPIALNNSTRYYWRIRAKNDYGWGDWSQIYTYRTPFVQPYPWSWSDAEQAASGVQTLGVATDPQGSVYVCGWFAGNAMIDTVYMNSVNGSRDLFVAKFDTLGRAQWVRQAGGYYDDEARSIAVDPNGNAYITGYVTNTTMFSANPTISKIEWCQWQCSQPNILVAKYNTDGIFQWSKLAGNSEWDIGHSIALNPNQEPVITGFFRGAGTFDSKTLTSVGGADIFVAQYSTSGTVQWAQRAGGTGNDYGKGVSCDPSGTIAITGSFQGSATFGTTASVSGYGGDDIFVAKFSTTGTALWAKSAGDAYGGTSSDGNQNSQTSYRTQEGGGGVVQDAVGNVYITGTFESLAVFDTTTVFGYNNDMFLAKYSPSGNLLWVTRDWDWQSQNEYGYSVTLDGNGYVYVGGFNGNDANMFIRRYDNQGVRQWTLWGGGNGSNPNYGAQAIAFDSKNNLYAVGLFSTSGNSYLYQGGTPLQSVGTSGFISRFNPYNVPEPPKLSAPTTGARNRSVTSLTLSWNPSLRAQTYTIQVARDWTFGSVQFQQSGLTSTNYTVTGLESNRMYYWRVYASNVSGNSEYSEVWNFKTGGTNVSPWQIAENIMGASSVQGLATDSSGNIYAAGQFSGVARFDTKTLSSVDGSWDRFIAKYNQFGVLQWVQQEGGRGNDIFRDVEVDRDKNIAVIGDHDNYLRRRWNNTVGSYGARDIDIERYFNDGYMNWSVLGGAGSNDYGYALGIDSSGKIYATGTFYTSMTLGSTQVVGDGGDDFWVARFFTDGSLDWVRVGKGTGTDRSFGLTLDKNANVYVTGDFNSGSMNYIGAILNTSGSYDSFIIKINPEDGSPNWFYRGSGGGDERGQAISADRLGNVFWTGYYYNTFAVSTATLSTGGNTYDIFTAKFSTTGTLQWLRGTGGSNGHDYSQSLISDGLGGVYSVGHYYGSGPFGVGGSNANTWDGYWAQVSSTGSTVQAQRFGLSSSDYTYAVSSDSFGNFFIGGSLQNSQTLGSTPLYSNAGTSDVGFFARLGTTSTMSIAPPSLVSPANTTEACVSANPKLSWSLVQNATNYRLQVSRDAMFSTIVIDRDDYAGTSASITGLLNTTQYWWRVQASNPFTTSTWSSVWTFKTCAPPCISASPDSLGYGKVPKGAVLIPEAIVRHCNLTSPITIRIEGANPEGFDFSLSSVASGYTGGPAEYQWTEPTSYFGMAIRFKPISISTYNAVMVITTEGTSCTIKLNGEGIMPPPTPPLLVYPSTGATRVSTVATFVWKAVSFATGYDVEVSWSSDFSTIVTSGSVGSVTTATLGGMVYGTEYWWRVRTRIGNDVGAWSESTQFRSINADVYLGVQVYLQGNYNPSTRYHRPAGVIVELRTGNELWTSTLARRESGIVSTSGTVMVRFAGMASGNYWIVVRSASHVAVASSGRVGLLTGTENRYDFTDESTKASGYGSTVPTGSGYAVRSGDLDGDGNILARDGIVYLLTNFGQFNPGQCPVSDITTSEEEGEKTEVAVKVYMQGKWNGTVHKKVPAMIELRTGDSLPSSIGYQAKAGIVSTTGVIQVTFANVATGEYWIVVRGGGNVPVGISGKVMITSGIGMSYDMTTGSGQVYGSGATIPSGTVWIVRSGDLDGDRAVNASDAVLYFVPNMGQFNPGDVPEE